MTSDRRARFVGARRQLLGFRAGMCRALFDRRFRQPDEQRRKLGESDHVIDLHAQLIVQRPALPSSRLLLSTTPIALGSWTWAAHRNNASIARARESRRGRRGACGATCTTTTICFVRAIAALLY
jgi:hypothetical protein